jgi:RHS repeat-associated protein
VKVTVFVSTNQVVPGQDLTYVYDAAGNRVKTIINGTTTEYSTNDRNEYTTGGDVTYGYDKDGNLISQTGSSDTTSFAYNSLNELIKVVTPTDTWIYQYNALGERVAAIHNGEKITYVLDPTGLGNVIAAYDSSGNLVNDYAYGVGLVMQSGPNGADYYQFDALGSTVGLTDGSGNLANTYSYDPFGQQLSVANSVAKPFGFVGLFGVFTDPQTGLQLMRARFFDPAIGRFTAQDPLHQFVGNVNLYSYANNCPTTKVDPAGKFPIPTGWLTAIIVIVGLPIFAYCLRCYLSRKIQTAISYGQQPADT